MLMLNKRIFFITYKKKLSFLNFTFTNLVLKVSITFFYKSNILCMCQHIFYAVRLMINNVHIMNRNNIDKYKNIGMLIYSINIIKIILLFSFNFVLL